MAWPSSVATNADLYLAKNLLQTTLASAINNSVTTISLTSAAGFPTSGIVRIDDEFVSYTGISSNDLTGCTRGFDSTTAVSHLLGVLVKHEVMAQHHNSVKDELIAVENSLATGTMGQILTSNGSGVPATFQAAGGGSTSIVQIVTALDTTFQQTANSTLLDTSLTATITPTSSSHKILVIVNQGIATGTSGSILQLQLSHVIGGTPTIIYGPYEALQASTYANINYPIFYLDAPATTSPVTYKTQVGTPSGVNVYVNNNNTPPQVSTITLIEIAGI